MTTPTKNAPGRCWNTAEGKDLDTNREEGVSVMTTVSRPCLHCTVSTPNADGVCSFCRDYAGGPVDSDVRSCCGGLGGHRPGCLSHNVAGLLVDAGQGVRMTVADLTEAIASVPDEAPLLAVVDLVSARAHMLAAQRLIDRASARLGDGSADR